MSKRLKNYPDPMLVVEKYGRYVVQLHFFFLIRSYAFLFIL
jgi:isoleucyl-tRNA synthetase